MVTETEVTSIYFLSQEDCLRFISNSKNRDHLAFILKNEILALLKLDIIKIAKINTAKKQLLEKLLEIAMSRINFEDVADDLYNFSD